jgi:hypothetical protein
MKELASLVAWTGACGSVAVSSKFEICVVCGGRLQVAPKHALPALCYVVCCCGWFDGGRLRSKRAACVLRYLQMRILSDVQQPRMHTHPAGTTELWYGECTALAFS